MKTFYYHLFQKLTPSKPAEAHKSAFFSRSSIWNRFLLAAMLITAFSFSAYPQIPGKIHIGFIYPISSNGKHAPLDTNNLSIHLLAGVSASEDGFSFASLGNIILHDAKGIQVAGLVNSYGSGDGFAFAGFTNISRGPIKGAQFAGFANIAKDVKGAQFAGFANIANKVKGSQFAGFTNIANGSVSASQFSGFMNKAENVKGSQFSGFLNIAKKVKGVQISGFMNIADSSDYPLGIINIIKKGEKSVGLSIDETQTTLLSFRSGGKVLYGILGLGYNFKSKKELYAIEAGLGAHLLQTNMFRLNTELTSLVLENFKKGDYFKASLRVMPALKITRSIELFGGPSFNFLSTNTTEGKNLHKKFIHSWEDKDDNRQYTLYIGYTAGLHFLF